jgi:probable F420-dependent oxidoreductase
MPESWRTPMLPRDTARLGFVFPFPGLPLAAQREHVIALADSGYTDLWVGESDGADAVTPLATAAAWEPRLRVGSAIVSVFTRPPALLAMTAATLAEAAPGRFVLGVGASSAVVVQEWNAIEFARPRARVRDVVRFLRRALDGERVTESFGTFTVNGFRLQRPPAVPPPIFIAGLRAQMLELAGREGDGVVLTCLSADDVRAVLPTVTEAATAAGRPAPEVVAWITVCPSTDSAKVREIARRRIVGYLTVPAYAAFHAQLGRADALAPMREAWSRGDRGAAAAAIPDPVIDDLFVHGPPQACRDHLDRFAAAGVTTLLLEVLPGVVEPVAALRELALR